MKNPLLLCAIIAMLIPCCSPENPAQSLIKVENAQFLRDGKAYYFVGTNFWYAPLLASEGRGGNRERLSRELDTLKALGVDNLRIMVGVDGEDGVHFKVEPALQLKPGVYNDTLLLGLDYLMVELNRRKMTAVLFLNNSWEWTGGIGQYLEWTGHGKASIPRLDGWDPFQNYVGQFQGSQEAKNLFDNYIKDIVSRTNSITGKPYKEDPAIFSWQIANEPRPFGAANKESFAQWIASCAALIKSIDPNHMVSIGSEGKYGCEVDLNLYERICACPDVDYLNIHIWPYNWNWVEKDNMETAIDSAIIHSSAYIDEHLAIARKLGKPLVIEEFGFPRDGFSFQKTAPVSLRDKYYSHITKRVLRSAREGDVLSGCNFWAWGGLAKPAHEFWQPWDDYCGDPAQEEQGLNSVFASDTSTLNIIKNIFSL